MTVALVALPALVAAVLAAVDLGQRSLWLDEGATVAIASQHGTALWHAIAHDGGNMLVYYLLEHVIIGIFGAGTAALRMPSVLATATTGALVSLIALRLFSRPWPALAAGLLTAVSLPLVFWGQNARGYALMVTLAAGSFLALISILATPERRSPSRTAVVAYGATTLLSLYIGFDSVLVVAAQLALLVLWPRHARAVLATLIAVAIGCIPLVVLAVERGSGQLFWVPGLNGPVLGQAGTTILSAGLSPNFHYTSTSTPLAVLTALLLLAGAGAAWRGVWRDRDAIGIPLVWLAVPVVLGIAGAAAGEPIELARAGILVIPAVGLLLAWTIAHPRVPALTGGVLLAVLLALRMLQIVPAYGSSPENWRAAERYVAAHSPGGACVAFYPQDGRMPFDFYVRGQTAAARLTPVLPRAPWSRVVPFVEQYAAPGPAAVARTAAGCPTLWVLASHQGQRHGPSGSRANLRRYRRLLARLAGLYPHRTRARFGHAAVVWVTRFSR